VALILIIVGIFGVVITTTIHNNLNDHVCIDAIDEVLDVIHDHETDHINCANAHILDPTDFNHIPLYVSVGIMIVGFYHIYKGNK
jgi:hypothetical protein